MTHPQQLGFGFDEMLREQETAHLPGTMEAAIPYYRNMLERHHAAMLAGDMATAMKIRDEAHELATKLNGNSSLGISCRDGPGGILERETAAPAGSVPMWGQEGSFTIDVNGMKVRIEQDGLFGIGTFMSPAPGFSAHAVEYDKPFLSETGYRSFIGSRPEITPGMTPDVAARALIQAYLTRECKGKPRRIGQTYVEREMERRANNINHQQEREHD
jgi:hypothetical protein